MQGASTEEGGENENENEREKRGDKHTPFIGTLYSQSSFPVFLEPCDEAGGVKVAGRATVAMMPWWRGEENLSRRSGGGRGRLGKC